MKKDIQFGNFIGASLRAIGWIALICFTVTAVISIYEFSIGPIIFFGFFLFFYISISLAGWAFIGLPFHWLVCRYTSSQYYFYILAATLFTLGIYALGMEESSLFFGAIALIQALIFRFYVFKSKCNDGVIDRTEQRLSEDAETQGIKEDV